MIDNLLPYVKNVNYKYIAAKRRKTMKSRNKGIVKAMTMFAALIIMVTGLYGCAHRMKTRRQLQKDTI